MEFNRKININVNGNDHELEVDLRESLSSLLRHKLHLTGVKEGCRVGECGACTVLVDGVPTDSRIYLAVWANGKKLEQLKVKVKMENFLRFNRPLLMKE